MDYKSAIASRAKRKARDAANRADLEEKVRDMVYATMAQDAVRPYVGDIPKQSTATDVYREALCRLGVRGAANMPAEILPQVLRAQPRPGSVTAQDNAVEAARPRLSFVERFPDSKRFLGPGHAGMATDAASEKSFEERFPDAARLWNP